MDISKVEWTYQRHYKSLNTVYLKKRKCKMKWYDIERTLGKTALFVTLSFCVKILKFEGNCEEMTLLIDAFQY